MKGIPIMIRTKLLTAITCALTASLAFSAAAFSGGSGSAEDPYKVSRTEDLTELATMSVKDSLDGVYFVQTGDIAVNGAIAAIASNSEYPFMGSYNGMDYKISGADINLSGKSAGLFIYTDDAEIKNVHISDASLTISEASGGIVSRASGETIIDGCRFEGEIVASADTFLGCNAGGIAGYINENVTVTDCYAAAELSLKKSPLVLYAGGIAGYNKGKISECESTVDFNAVSDNYLIGLGGIVGENAGTLSGCETEGTVSGSISNDVAHLYIGGIAGHNNGGKIERALNKARLSAVGYNEYPGYIGGIAGYNQNGDIEISNNNGSVGGNVNFAGGVTGINYASSGVATVNECLNIGEITVSTGVIGGLVGGNLATEKSENVSTVSSSINLYELTEGNGAVGLVQTDFVGVSTTKNLIVRNLTDKYATTMTDNELKAATGINALSSDAWVYPKDGFFPSLAVVKNLAKAEAIATAVDSENSKVAFTVYNPGNETNAVAVLSFFKEGRFTGAKLANINATKGYSVHTVSTDLAKAADSVKVTVVNNLSGFAPITAADSY